MIEKWRDHSPPTDWLENKKKGQILQVKMIPNFHFSRTAENQLEQIKREMIEGNHTDFNHRHHSADRDVNNMYMETLEPSKNFVKYMSVCDGEKGKIVRPWYAQKKFFVLSTLTGWNWLMRLQIQKNCQRETYVIQTEVD